MQTIVQGDTPILNDTLTDAAGVVDLTGATVEFIAQAADGSSWTKPGAIVLATAGTVKFQFAAADTATLGAHRAQWRITLGATVRTFPSEGYIEYTITEAVPVPTSPGVTLWTECHELVRALLGDLNPAHQRYAPEAIDAVLRSVVRLGGVPGYTVTPNQRGVQPALADARAYGLLVYRAALKFVRPNAEAYSYGTRAMRESFGHRYEFLKSLENELFDLENGAGGVFTTFQSFYGWVNATTGLNLWQTMAELKTNAPIATATIGREGLTISSP